MSQPGRNDPCPCGSERRYKACCGRLRDGVVPLAVTDGELDRLHSLMSAGRFNELEWQARALLASKPGAGMVWQLLGAALRARENRRSPAIERAAELMPGEAAAHANISATRSWCRSDR